MGHILENMPGNVAASLRGRHHSSTTRAFPVNVQSGTAADDYSDMPDLTGQQPDNLWLQDDHSSWSFASMSQPLTQNGEDRPMEVDRNFSGTDTDSSSDEYEDMDYPEDITSLPTDQRGEALYWAYSQSK